MKGVFFRRAASGGVSRAGHGHKSPLPLRKTCLSCRAKKSALHTHIDFIPIMSMTGAKNEA
jgi:hypothetical protein